MLGQPLLKTTAKRLGRGVSFGQEEPVMSFSGCIPTTYDAGHRHQVCSSSIAGFGQTPPSLPKPPIPGYVTEEDCAASKQALKAGIAEDMKVKHAMLGGGGLLVGLVIGYALGR